MKKKTAVIIITALIIIFYAFISFKDVVRLHSSLEKDKTVKLNLSIPVLRNKILNLKYIKKPEVWGLKEEVSLNSNSGSANGTNYYIKKNGLYKICSKQVCYELLGIVSKGGNFSAAFFVPNAEPGKNSIVFLKKNDNITKGLKIVRVMPDEIAVEDSEDNKTIDIKLFDVDLKQFKPKSKEGK